MLSDKECILQGDFQYRLLENGSNAIQWTFTKRRKHSSAGLPREPGLARLAKRLQIVHFCSLLPELTAIVSSSIQSSSLCSVRHNKIVFDIVAAPLLLWLCNIRSILKRSSRTLSSDSEGPISWCSKASPIWVMRPLSALCHARTA